MNNHTRTARSQALLALALGSLLLVVTACGGGDEQQAPKTSAQTGTAADASRTSHTVANLAGVLFVAPAGWTDAGAAGMRQAQYRLAPVAGDQDGAEVNVFYFGPQSGGGTEANLDRWLGQMSLPDGSDIAKAAVRSTFEADGMAGHVISVDGTYKAGSMRPMGGDVGEPKPGYRLVGVVLEGPQGSLFFKLTGPAATARAMETDLLKMVAAARKAD